MNKEIEEIAKDLPEKIKDPFDNSRFILYGKSERREIAKVLYKVGYRKIDNNTILIHKDGASRTVGEIEFFVKHNAEVRKGTTKGILQKIKARSMWFIESQTQEDHFIEQIQELAKEQSVEIE